MAKIETPLFSGQVIGRSVVEAFKMLHPKAQIRNPVMFVTFICAIVTLSFVAVDIWHNTHTSFDVQIALWLLFTVLFANFSQGLAESRGRAQAASLKHAKVSIEARRVDLKGKEERVPADDLRKGDLIICEAGDLIPADGEVVEGIATVNESAITGESAPVIRESGGDRSPVTAGTTVLSDRLVIKVFSEAGDSFLDRMISLIEGAKRQKTPNEIALHIVLSALTIIFLLTTCSIKTFADYSSLASKQNISGLITVPVLVALLVCLIPTTISALLGAVGIAGMDRLVRRNVIAKSGRSVEAAGDIDLLILDKTGTITIGNRMATEFIPAKGVSERDFADIAQLASLGDETPEGRSVVVLAKKLYDLRAASLDPSTALVIPFSAKTRISGIDIGSRHIRKGAVDALVAQLGTPLPLDLKRSSEQIAKGGGTPLLVSDNGKFMGLIHLKDIVKGGMKKRFLELRQMGIRTVMVTGDNPLTAAAIAAEAGVDDYVAQATPEMKLDLIRKEQAGGRLVAMTGDGTNDAPALAQADVAVAMNTGTQASREAGNMIDLDSNPTKLIDIVEIGKQLLMTRGALTAFSIANDVAKYFAILPALFGSLYLDGGANGPLNGLNVMMLHSPKSAILSAVIFNALIIVALIPLALKGVKYRPQGADQILKRNVFVYGLGGLIAPFIGIKLIDMALSLFWEVL